MTDYQKKLSDKVTQIFKKAEVEDNWKACYDQMVELVTLESRKSFQKNDKVVVA